MYDAAMKLAAVAAQRGELLSQLGVEPKRYVLATIHRAENTDDPARLANIVSGLETVAARLPVVLLLHPRMQTRMKAAGLAFEKVQAVPPVGYLDMVALESQAALIVTDSGGVQKEAFYYHISRVTRRDEAEWVELIELGWNRLASLPEVTLRKSSRRLWVRVVSMHNPMGTIMWGRGDRENIYAQRREHGACVICYDYLGSPRIMKVLK